MGNFQMTIDGALTSTENHAREAERILEVYPAFQHRPGDFLLMCLRHRSPWVSQLGEEKLNELRAFFENAQSLDKRRREYISSIPH